MGKYLLIIQARLGSTRLPGKILKDMAGKTLMDHLLDRMAPSRKIDKIAVATTTEKGDDILYEFLLKKGVYAYRGSEADVLDRFYQCAQSSGPWENIIRVTSDCPMNSYLTVDRVIEEYENSGADYYSNSNNEPDFLEDGFDVEVFTFQSLKTAWQKARLSSQREHVTPFIKDSGLFKCAWGKTHPGYQYKLSVDTIEDFNAVSEIVKHFPKDSIFSIQDVVNLLKEKPEILTLNKESEINSGYKKSLKNDYYIDE